MRQRGSPATSGLARGEAAACARGPARRACVRAVRGCNGGLPVSLIKLGSGPELSQGAAGGGNQRKGVAGAAGGPECRGTACDARSCAPPQRDLPLREGACPFPVQARTGCT